MFRWFIPGCSKGFCPKLICKKGVRVIRAMIRAVISIISIIRVESVSRSLCWDVFVVFWGCIGGGGIGCEVVGGIGGGFLGVAHFGQ